MKTFCSGGDEQEARKNHKDEVNFMIQATPFLCVNDMPEVKPSDALNKCVKFLFASKFVSDGDMTKWGARTLSFTLYKADDTIKEVFIRRPEVCNEFVLILLETYKKHLSFPKSIQREVQ